MSNEQMNYVQEDEIDLRELFKTICAKKWFIVIFTCIVTLGAVVYALLKTPIYEIKSNVRVGYIGTELIENPDIIVKMLSIVFNVEDKVVTKDKSLSEVVSIETNKKLKDFIEVKTQAISNEEGLKKNKEVIGFLQNYYQPKINEYIKNKTNSIADTQNALVKVDTFERKNIENQINILKKQRVVKIDEDIEKLKTQDIPKLEKQIEILKTQKIANIDEDIEFLSSKKIPMLETKIEFYKNNLEEYTKEIKKLYSKSTNTTEATIVSIQMVNYQNLILSARNSIEDLILQIFDIQKNQILALEREKSNIEKVNIRDLELQIENIKNTTIANLQREKENITNDALRKLEYTLNVELENKKIKLQQDIEKLKYEISPQNIQNSMVVGEYIAKDYPIKPKKRLIVTVAFVTGFILSIFLVFILDFVRGINPKPYM